MSCDYFLITGQLKCAGVASQYNMLLLSDDSSARVTYGSPNLNGIFRHPKEQKDQQLFIHKMKRQILL